MAVRGWGGSVATAIGVAAGAGAAQLGLGYGLGIIAWLPAADGRSEAAWVAGLAWSAWIAATSTVAGAICAQRLGTPRAARAAAGGAPLLSTGLQRLALALASAVGGLVTVVLVAVPARAATRADTLSPQTIAAGYAVIGVIIGLLVALWALTSPAVAGNIVATVGWLWLLAVVAVIDSVVSGRGVVGAQLGVWQLTSDSDRFWFRNYFYWPGAALSLGSALVIGALAARSAARRPAARVGAAVSGVTGPLLVATAYFLAAPQLVGIRAEQMSAHLMAPYAVVAGLAGSALVAAIAQRAEIARRPAEITTGPPEADGTARAPQQRTGSDPDGERPDRTGGDRPTRTTGDRSTLAADDQQARAADDQPVRTGKGKPARAGDERPDLAGDGYPPARTYADETTGRRTTEPARGQAGPARAKTARGKTALATPARPEPPSGEDRGAGDALASAADPAADDEPAGGDKPKGRLGRLGRRSR